MERKKNNLTRKLSLMMAFVMMMVTMNVPGMVVAADTVPMGAIALSNQTVKMGGSELAPGGIMDPAEVVAITFDLSIAVNDGGNSEPYVEAGQTFTVPLVSGLQLVSIPSVPIEVLVDTDGDDIADTLKTIATVDFVDNAGALEAQITFGGDFFTDMAAEIDDYGKLDATVGCTFGIANVYDSIASEGNKVTIFGNDYYWAVNGQLNLEKTGTIADDGTITWTIKVKGEATGASTFVFRDVLPISIGSKDCITNAGAINITLLGTEWGGATTDTATLSTNTLIYQFAVDNGPFEREFSFQVKVDKFLLAAGAHSLTNYASVYDKADTSFRADANDTLSFTIGTKGDYKKAGVETVPFDVDASGHIVSGEITWTIDVKPAKDSGGNGSLRNVRVDDYVASASYKNYWDMEEIWVTVGANAPVQLPKVNLADVDTTTHTMFYTVTANATAPDTNTYDKYSFYLGDISEDSKIEWVWTWDSALNVTLTDNARYTNKAYLYYDGCYGNGKMYEAYTEGIGYGLLNKSSSSMRVLNGAPTIDWTVSYTGAPNNKGAKLAPGYVYELLMQESVPSGASNMSGYTFDGLASGRTDIDLRTIAEAILRERTSILPGYQVLQKYVDGSLDVTVGAGAGTAYAFPIKKGGVTVGYLLAVPVTPGTPTTFTYQTEDICNSNSLSGKERTLYNVAHLFTTGGKYITEKQANRWYTYTTLAKKALPTSVDLDAFTGAETGTTFYNFKNHTLLFGIEANQAGFDFGRVLKADEHLVVEDKLPIGFTIKEPLANNVRVYEKTVSGWDIVSDTDYTLESGTRDGRYLLSVSFDAAHANKHYMVLVKTSATDAFVESNFGDTNGIWIMNDAYLQRRASDGGLKQLHSATVSQSAMLTVFSKALNTGKVSDGELWWTINYLPVHESSLGADAGDGTSTYIEDSIPDTMELRRDPVTGALVFTQDAITNIKVSRYEIDAAGKATVAVDVPLVEGTNIFYDPDTRLLRFKVDRALAVGYTIEFVTDVTSETSVKIKNTASVYQSTLTLEETTTEYAFAWSNASAVISKLAKFTIAKRDAADAAVKDAVFTLTSSIGLAPRTFTVTDAGGDVEINRLRPGTYTLKETTAPSGYDLNPTVYTIVVTGKNVSITPDLTVTGDGTASAVLKVVNTLTPTVTPEPSATVTPEPSATATPEPSATATPEPSAAATPEPSATATPEPSATATPTIPTIGPNDVPDPNDPNSPDEFLLVDEDGNPLGMFTKRQQPDGMFDYFDEDGNPLGGFKANPPTGDSNRTWPVWSWSALVLAAGGLMLMKRKVEEER